MNRRECITLFGGAVAAWPVRAHAQQQSQAVRRVGVLMHTVPNEPEAQARLDAFTQAMQEAGWEVGRNLRVDARWIVSDVPRLRKDAADLVALRPDVILAGVGATTLALQEATRTVPIVFAQGLDPVGAGQVASLSQPGGNATGFTQFEYGLAGKWLELLKEVSPSVSRVAVVREQGVGGIGQWAVLQAAASTLGVELSPIELHDAEGIKRDVTAFGRAPNRGLVIVVSAASQIHRELIVTLAAQHRLPTVYPYRFFVDHGGLISYGPDLVVLYRRAATYVDRILKGEKPADLPVQAPTKYELAINQKTARALGITVPPTLLARADEVIE